jgi:ribosome-associated translation inhibitor RaiA
MGIRSAGHSDVVVRARGRVSSTDHVYAHTRTTDLVLRTSGHVLFARVDLRMAGDGATAEPALANAELDVDGQVVRAQATGETMHAAIDAMEARLRRQLGQSAGSGPPD